MLTSLPSVFAKKQIIKMWHLPNRSILHWLFKNIDVRMFNIKYITINLISLQPNKWFTPICRYTYRSKLQFFFFFQKSLWNNLCAVVIVGFAVFLVSLFEIDNEVNKNFKSFELCGKFQNVLQFIYVFKQFTLYIQSFQYSFHSTLI